MSNSNRQPTYARHRWTSEIFPCAVWLNHRFRFSYCDAGLWFFRKLRSTFQQKPRVIITDRLRRYQAALHSILSVVARRQHKGSNNCTEASHRRMRKRQCFMHLFASRASAQQYIPTLEYIQVLTRPIRYISTAAAFREQMADCYA